MEITNSIMPWRVRKLLFPLIMHLFFAEPNITLAQQIHDSSGADTTWFCRDSGPDNKIISPADTSEVRVPTLTMQEIWDKFVPDIMFTLNSYLWERYKDINIASVKLDLREFQIVSPIIALLRIKGRDAYINVILEKKCIDNRVNYHVLETSNPVSYTKDHSSYPDGVYYSLEKWEKVVSRYGSNTFPPENFALINGRHQFVIENVFIKP